MKVRKIIRLDIKYISYTKNKELVSAIIEQEIDRFKNGKTYICSIDSKQREYKDFVIHIDNEKWEYLREFCKNNGNVTITMMMNLFIKENISLIKE